MKRMKEYLDMKFPQTVELPPRKKSIFEFENCLLGFCLIGYLFVVLYNELVLGLKSVFTQKNYESNV